MKKIKELKPYKSFIALALFSLAVLLVAYGAQYILGLKPCLLCEYQRALYVMIFLVASLTPFFHAQYKNPFVLRSCLAFCFLVLLASVCLAIFHVLVEHKIIDFDTVCTSGGILQHGDDVRRQIFANTRPPCSEPQLLLWGLSLASYNMIVSTVAALFSFFAIKRLRK